MPYEVDIIFATFTDEKISSRRNSPKATLVRGRAGRWNKGKHAREPFGQQIISFQ